MSGRFVMKTKFLAVTLGLSGILSSPALAGAVGAASAGSASAAAASVEKCMGLACPDPNHDVPEARGPATSLSGSREFAAQINAGFYEYGLLNPAWRKRAVAYVVPPGQADRMPASVRALPIVTALASETDIFEDGSTVFIVDRQIVGWVPTAELRARRAQSDRKRSKIRRRMIARAAQSGVGNCPNNFFCIYDFQNLQGEGWGLYGYPTGWLSLSACCNNFNDQAESHQSRRERDSLLNKHNPPQGGSDRYCAESNTVDFDLGNNFGGDGRNQASMIANTGSDQQC